MLPLNDLREAIAKIVYDQWTDKKDFVSWVDRGNSFKQDDARKIAHSIIALTARLDAPQPVAPSIADTLSGVGALLWVLWHHQGASSTVGQPIRAALGIGQYDRLTDKQVEQAKRWGELHANASPPTAAAHPPEGWRIVPREPTQAMLDAMHHVKRMRLLKSVDWIKQGKNPDDLIGSTLGDEWKAGIAAAPTPPTEPVAPMLSDTVGWIAPFTWRKHQTEVVIKITRDAQPKHGFKQQLLAVKNDNDQRR